MNILTILFMLFASLGFSTISYNPDSRENPVSTYTNYSLGLLIWLYGLTMCGLCLFGFEVKFVWIYLLIGIWPIIVATGIHFAVSRSILPTLFKEGWFMSVYYLLAFCLFIYPFFEASSFLFLSEGQGVVGFSQEWGWFYFLQLGWLFGVIGIGIYLLRNHEQVTPSLLILALFGFGFFHLLKLPYWLFFSACILVFLACIVGFIFLIKRPEKEVVGYQGLLGMLESTDFFSIIERTGQIRHLSTRSRELLGFTATTSLEGKNLFDHILLTNDTPYEPNIQQQEVQLKIGEDINIPVTIIATKLGPKNNPSGYGIIGFDTAHYHQKNKELAEYNLKLKASNYELSQFANILSHELKEPIRTVNSFVQLLARRSRKTLEPDVQEYIDYIEGGATRMSNLINTLLQYTKIEGGKKSKQDLEFEDLLLTVKKDLHLNIAESNAIFLVRNKIPNLFGNYSQLVQLFRNLISNSIKYKGAERPIIDIRFKDDPEFWYITLSDNGIGIDPADRKSVFKIFNRSNQTKIEGRGIGLAICEKIIENHKGEIWIDEKNLIGTVFHIRIPIIKSSTQKLDSLVSEEG